MSQSSHTHQSDEEISKQAAEWLVLLDDDANEELKNQFAQWVDENPKHQAAINRLQYFINDVQSVTEHSIDQKASKRIIHQAIQKQQQAYSYFKKSILGIATIGSAFVLSALFYAPIDYWTADQHNTSQSWQDTVLQDQSQIKVSGKTAYNIEYSTTQRRIELLQGNILVDVAKDTNRPFMVQTQHGTVQALGTRFIVTQDGQKTIVTMLESKTVVWAKQHPHHQIRIIRGQRLELNDQGLVSLQPIIVNAQLIEQAWQQKRLVVHDENLVDVLDYLSIYYTGKISFDRRALSNIRVTATLPLDDIDMALQQLAIELDLNIQASIPYFRKIEKH